MSGLARFPRVPQALAGLALVVFGLSSHTTDAPCPQIGCGHGAPATWPWPVALAVVTLVAVLVVIRGRRIPNPPGRADATATMYFALAFCGVLATIGPWVVFVIVLVGDHAVALGFGMLGLLVMSVITEGALRCGGASDPDAFVHGHLFSLAASVVAGVLAVGGVAVFSIFGFLVAVPIVVAAWTLGGRAVVRRSRGADMTTPWPPDPNDSTKGASCSPIR